MFQDTPALQSQGAFCLGHGKKFNALKIVEIGNAIKHRLLCFREDGQSLIAVTAHVSFTFRCRIVRTGPSDTGQSLNQRGTFDAKVAAHGSLRHAAV